MSTGQKFPGIHGTSYIDAAARYRPRIRERTLRRVGAVGLILSFLSVAGYSLAAAPARAPRAVERASSRAESAPSPRLNEFYFTRAIYSAGLGGYGRGNAWATDFPKADQQFLSVLRRLEKEIDASATENAVRLEDPDLRRFPFVYAVEVGHMTLTDSEVAALRSFLLAGGFLVVDDFWGTQEYAAFEQTIGRVLPEYRIVDLPLSHPIFHAYYDIEEIRQVPNVYNAQRGGQTWERDGYVAQVKGILDEKGRLMVMINFNTDLGDAWEWAEQPYYPLQYSTYAFQLGVNMIVYGMSH